mmetsp:Transcript_25274/g.38230  ORF Transcript_25274/g.38230 Transcript_25274/m.38230 type:complete len:198 (-) Transcript_25274:141-734(-)
MAEAEAADEKTAGTKAPCDATTIAFVSFLRSEAEAADSRAKQLWAQAEKLIHDHGLEQHFQSAPKKPGRKPKRKRANDPDRKKPKLTGYTLFMKEANSTVREENPSLNAQTVVQRVAQLWNEKSDEQKQEWKSKAEDHSNENAKKDEGVDKEKATSKREDGNEKVNADKAEDNEKVNADKAEDKTKDQSSEVVQLVV